MPAEYGGDSKIPLGQWILEEHIAAQVADPERRWPAYVDEDLSGPQAPDAAPPPDPGDHDFGEGGGHEGAGLEGAEEGNLSL